MDLLRISVCRNLARWIDRLSGGALRGRWLRCFQKGLQNRITPGDVFTALEGAYRNKPIRQRLFCCQRMLASAVITTRLWKVAEWPDHGIAYVVARDGAWKA